MRKALISVLTVAHIFLLLNCNTDSNDDNKVVLDTPMKKALQQAIMDAEQLLQHAITGVSEGQFSAESKDKFSASIQSARTFFNDNMSGTTDLEIEHKVHTLYDSCMAFEARVISSFDNLIDRKATHETRYLYENLKKYAGEKLLFGMHDATGYGVGWSGDDDRSDVKDVCGSYPAVFSWDANGIVNVGDWSRLKNRMLLAYTRGGINTICWHQFDPEGKGFYYDRVNYPVVPTILPGGKYHESYQHSLRQIARFMKSLRGPRGESVPVIFRPYHEQNGNWFWWGRSRCTEQEYIDLWRFTVHFLRDTLGLHNFIYAFSPDGNQYNQKSEYLNQYPGDEYIDVLGLDFYFGSGDTEEILKFQRRAIDAVQYARDKNKLAAITEVGDRYGWDDTDMLEIEQWFTRCLLGAIKNSPTAKNMVYAAVWRNAHARHHFAPYPGHPSVADFLVFYYDPMTVFLDDLADVYTLESGL